MIWPVTFLARLLTQLVPFFSTGVAHCGVLQQCGVSPVLPWADAVAHR